MEEAIDCDGNALAFRRRAPSTWKGGGRAGHGAGLARPQTPCKAPPPPPTHNTQRTAHNATPRPPRLPAGRVMLPEEDDNLLYWNPLN
jgi:hypothetical protein